MGVRLYCGINETVWNHHPVAPGPYACVAPVYGSSIETKTKNRVNIPKGTLVIQDSGAFCDGIEDRLSFKEALERQLRHARDSEYFGRREAVASYDLLIDEKWNEGGKRRKERWSKDEAKYAVEETIEAAKYLSRNRSLIEDDAIALVLSCQGVTPEQYLECAKRVVPLLAPHDILGLGGWCILGQKRSLMPIFEKTISLVVPYAALQGVERIHIWGVCYAPALGKLLWMCDKYNILLSTDSSGPQVRPCLGSWGYMGWRNNDYERPPVETRGLERKRHVEAVRDWLQRLDKTKYYAQPSYQLRLRGMDNENG